MLMTVLSFGQCLQIVSRISSNPYMSLEAKTDVINVVIKHTTDGRKCDANVRLKEREC